MPIKAEKKSLPGAPVVSRPPGSRKGPRLDRMMVKTAPGAPAVRKGRRRDRSKETEQLKEKIAMPKNLVRANRACESPDRFLPRVVASTSRIKLDCQPYLSKKVRRNGSEGKNVTRLQIPDGVDKAERDNMARWLAKADAISANLNR